MTLEVQADTVEQYSHRANLRFQGIPDSGEWEDTDMMIIKLINEHMKVEPLVQIDVDSFRANLLNTMRNGNVHVVHSSVATNQAQCGSGATTLV